MEEKELKSVESILRKGHPQYLLYDGVAYKRVPSKKIVKWTKSNAARCKRWSMVVDHVTTSSCDDVIDVMRTAAKGVIWWTERYVNSVCDYLNRDSQFTGRGGEDKE